MKMDDELRVATVIAPPHWGGLYTVVARTERYLHDLGIYRTVIIPPNSNNRERLENAGCDVVEIDIKRLRKPPSIKSNTKYILSFGEGIENFSKLYKDIGADVVEVAGLHHFQPALAAKLINLPLVWAVHSTAIAQPFRTLFGALASRLADSILCSGSTLSKRHGGLVDSKVVPFRAPIDTDEFKPNAERRAEARRALCVSDSDIVVGTLGAFGWQKNHGLLVEAAKCLKIKGGSLKIRICGNAVESDASYFNQHVIREIECNNLSEDGYVKIIKQDLPAAVLMNGFDIFALPSQAEGLSLVTAEAAATGLPILGSNVGSVSDLIQCGVNGYLLKPKDVVSWAERISEIASSDDKLHSFGVESRKIALESIGSKLSAYDHRRAYLLAKKNADEQVIKK